MKITMYTKTVCSECAKLKQVIGYVPVEVEVDYRNIEEGENHEQYAQELADLGYSSVPVTIFPDGKTIIGYEVGELQEAFGL